MDSRRRSIAKALSWRTVATTCTGGIVWGLTGQWEAAVSVGALDVVVKLLVYYAHERAWARIGFGLDEPSRVSSAGAGPFVASGVGAPGVVVSGVVVSGVVASGAAATATAKLAGEGAS